MSRRCHCGLLAPMGVCLGWWAFIGAITALAFCAGYSSMGAM